MNEGKLDPGSESQLTARSKSKCGRTEVIYYLLRRPISKSQNDDVSETGEGNVSKRHVRK
jgi:hypothetical protein